MSVFAAVHRRIEQEREALIGLSRAIHSNPELGDQEFFAARSLAGYLESQGFTVTMGVAGLETAFTAVSNRGEGGWHVAFCAEYDALPKIGHGCGHNLIGVAAVAAAVGLAAGTRSVDHPFRISVIGTPSEETRGGKIDLLKAGVFDGVDVAMMFHPGYSTVMHVETLACRDYVFIFHGRNAHAASEPWEGRNALDGVLLTFNGINALRQHLKDDVRIHGVIIDGGGACNIVPDRAAAQFCIRSRDNLYLEEVVERVLNCARGAALISGTEVEIRESGNPFAAMLSNRVLEKVFWEALQETGYRDDAGNVESMGSIDMGNVSRVVPAIHPVLAVSDRVIVSHTAEFAQACDMPRAYETMLQAGKAMGVTALRLLLDSTLQEQVRAEFMAAPR